MKNSVLWLMFGGAAGYLIAYAAYIIAGENLFIGGGLPAMLVGTACLLYIIIFTAGNCRKRKEPMYILFGRLMINTVWLNMFKDIDTYLCLQGNTGCLCLTIEENKTVVYQNRSFLINETNIRKMIRDVQVMRRYKQRKGVLPDVCN